MGNRVSAEEAKGAGKDVIQQAQKGSNELYEYVDVKGGGRLVEAFRRARARKNVAEVEELIDAFGSKFLYNNGAGKEVDVAELVQWRHQSREVQLPSKKRKNALLSLFAKWTDRVQDTLDVVGSDYRTLAEGASKFRVWVQGNHLHLLMEQKEPLSSFLQANNST